MTALTAEALRLPAKERLKLIEEVWDSLTDAAPESMPMSGAELHELERRRDAYRARPESLVDWQELKSQIRQWRKDAH